jgi:putative DNA primase/helicase
MIDTASILAQFRTAAAARGLLLPDHLDADGKLHRCELASGAKGKRDGAYLLHLDGVPAGGFQNFKDGLDWESWRADIGRQLTPEEEAAARARMEAQRAEREAEAKAKRDKARRKANAIWNSAKPAPAEHPYLLRKNVPSFGLRVGSWPKWEEVRLSEWRENRIPGVLLVPMRSASGTLHSLQAIYPDKVDGRDKDFLPGGEKAGKFHLIGEVSADLPLCVAEGYATAASIHQVMGWPVAVAFDAGSLEPVARTLREAHPAASIIVCADDDHQTPGNPGRTKAEAAARAVGGVVAVPEFSPERPDNWTDFNDLATSPREGEGPDAVRRLLDAARAALGSLQRDETPPAAPIPAPESETPASGPEAAPAAPSAPPSDEPEKPARRPRSKAKGKAPSGQTPAQGGELFELRDGNEGRGVYRLKVEKRGEGLEQVEQYVCAPLEITHQVRDARGENWQRLATFNDHDNRRRRVLVPDEMLEGDGAALARLLRGQGLFIGNNKGGLLKMYVNGSRPPARARLTARIGWHDDCTEPGRWSFVLGGDHDPLAPEGAELWLHQAQGSGHAQFKQAGTLADWRDNVAALAVGNSRLTFALSAAFAGGLCWLHPNVSGGFHWSGGSSLGKSGLLYAAASLCGPKEYRKTWLLTATAIEGVAAGHCDAPLLLDELKQAGNPKDVAQAAYMLTSGQGKGRGQAAGGLRETATFSLLFQSNGEIGLTQFLEE